MIHKYGLPLTDSDWSGLPMRVGHFPSAGRVEDLSSASDAVLLWTGATSHVDIAYRDGGDAIRERRFERRTGPVGLVDQFVRAVPERADDVRPGVAVADIQHAVGQ